MIPYSVFKMCSGWLESSLLNKNASYTKLQSFSGYFQEKPKLLIENWPHTLQLWAFILVPGTSALLQASLRSLTSQEPLAPGVLRHSCFTKARLAPKPVLKKVVNLNSEAPQTSYLPANNDIILKERTHMHRIIHK